MVRSSGPQEPSAKKRCVDEPQSDTSKRPKFTRYRQLLTRNDIDSVLKLCTECSLIRLFAIGLNEIIVSLCQCVILLISDLLCLLHVTS